MRLPALLTMVLAAVLVSARPQLRIQDGVVHATGTPTLKSFLFDVRTKSVIIPPRPTAVNLAVRDSSLVDGANTEPDSASPATSSSSTCGNFWLRNRGLHTAGFDLLLNDNHRADGLIGIFNVAEGCECFFQADTYLAQQVQGPAHGEIKNGNVQWYHCKPLVTALTPSIELHGREWADENVAGIEGEDVVSPPTFEQDVESAVSHLGTTGDMLYFGKWWAQNQGLRTAGFPIFGLVDDVCSVFKDANMGVFEIDIGSECTFYR